MRSRTLLYLTSLALLGCLSPHANAHETQAWEDLFNGKTLEGWTATGDRTAWGVRSGEIVTTKPGRGGWLRTTRMFRDFELELEFFMPENGNSGVGLRGTSNDDPAFTGFEVQILDTHGEEPGLRNCGAVYEAIPPRTMAVNEPGEWNAYRIRLIDDTLDVWLNGEHIHDNAKIDERGFFRSAESPLPLNARATTGYIALQDHGHAFRYRNIRVRDLSPDPEPKNMRSLMDMDLWFTDGGGTWSIEQGELVARDGPGHLFTRSPHENFELRALVHVNQRGNGGIYFHARPNPDGVWPIGFEAQIDNHDPRNFTGCLYDKAFPGEYDEPITRDEAWFDYRVRVQGKRVQTWINGKAMIDELRDDLKGGHIALQTHHPGNVLRFRDVRIIELDATSNEKVAR